ncbi:MAG: metallophosphoesterase family protein [Candidatus Mcinerneyibacterium aminivorans]|uniref:Metallophosphoesterase family protein n=1 Tax=Candidatus Mcinerneyibacterium aminivorans TaxID=2703815 RepID=A0A5D0MFL0_9BACT|nr:MAG: metallophosphoesterase family protein [Candidatus Mcinerneyibacterium aminivorans]
MKFAIISDIHGNYEAFKSLLMNLKEKDINHIINLGDIVGYGADPIKCIETIMYMNGEEVSNLDRNEKRIATGFRIKNIMGNHDSAVVNFTDVRFFNRMAYEAIIWTKEQLKHEHKSFLKKIQLSHQINEKYYFYHSTPTEIEEWNYIHDKSLAKYYFNKLEKKYIFVGHTHSLRFFIFREDNDKIIDVYPEKKIWELIEGYKYILNPGSIGQPRDGNFMPSYLILDTKRNKVHVERYEYDVNTAMKKITDAGLPYFLAERLRVGK